MARNTYDLSFFLDCEHKYLNCKIKEGMKATNNKENIHIVTVKYYKLLYTIILQFSNCL